MLVAGSAALTFPTMTTHPSFRAEFRAGEGGRIAVQMARRVNARGEKEPWSEVTTATVAQQPLSDRQPHPRHALHNHLHKHLHKRASA